MTANTGAQQFKGNPYLLQLEMQHDSKEADQHAISRNKMGMEREEKLIHQFHTNDMANIASSLTKPTMMNYCTTDMAKQVTAMVNQNVPVDYKCECKASKGETMGIFSFSCHPTK